MFEKYSDANPASRVRMTLRFALARPSHIAATFFGAGAMHPAPGTWGTAAAVLVFAIVQTAFSLPHAAWFAAAAIAFFIGIWAAAETARDLGVEDHGGVVIDEVAAVWLVCAGLPDGWGYWLAAFAAFRICDIVKIWPGCVIDRRMKGGFGVMADDLVAGAYAWAAVKLAEHFLLPLLAAA